jgi:hypothetical protein
MFADFKSRGFGVEDTQLRYADRLDRLILVMTLAHIDYTQGHPRLIVVAKKNCFLSLLSVGSVQLCLRTDFPQL